jgi:hypothetical protein
MNNYKIIKMGQLKVSFDKSLWETQNKSLGENGSGEIRAFISYFAFQVKMRMGIIIMVTTFMVCNRAP